MPLRLVYPAPIGACPPPARRHRLPPAAALALLIGLATAGCGSEDGHTHEADGSAADGTADGADGAAKVNTLLPDGDYLLGIKLSLGGVQLVAKAVVTAEGEAGKGGTILKIELYGANAQSWVDSVPFATAKDIAVAADGAFTIDFGDATVPSQASPTGTPVTAKLKLVGKLVAEGGVCGDVEGYVPDFEADLKGSTFRGVVWPGSVPVGYAVACPGTGGKVYEPIKTCPTLKAGSNTITSATFDRTFELYLPAAATATAGDKLPIVVLYHGNTGSAQGIAADTGWPEVAKDAAILVAPNTPPLVNGSKPVLDWRYGEKSFDMDNRELVLFDDLLSCIGKQYAADLNRVYVTGMSAGGMMTTFLVAHRSAKIAAAAPLSGGYLHDWPKTDRKVPVLFTWGGAGDTAYGQDFDKLAQAVLKVLTGNGHVHISCNHGTGHKIPAGFAKLQWQWFEKFTLTTSGDAHGGKLPADFPTWCTVGGGK